MFRIATCLIWAVLEIRRLLSHNRGPRDLPLSVEGAHTFVDNTLSLVTFSTPTDDFLDHFTKMIAAGKPPNDDDWKKKYREPPAPDTRLSIVAQMQYTIRAQLARADGLRHSILKRAFEGKLVPQDPNDEPASALLERIRAERAKVVTATAKRKGRRPQAATVVME